MCWSARAVGLDLPADATIEVAAGAGFEGVDLMVRDLVETGADVDRLRRKMDDLNLRGGGWTLPMNWKNDAEAFEADLKGLPAHAAVAQRLGLTRTGTWVRFETEPVDDQTRASRVHRERLANEVTDWQLDRLGRIARILDDHGSRLGLEIMGSQAAPTGRGVRLVGKYSELRQRFDGLAVEHSNVGVLADAFHLFAADETVDDALTGGVASVVWVHLADPAKLDRARLRDEERTLPGESGTSLCESLLDRLARWGYDGPVTVEPLGRCALLQGLGPIQTARVVRESLRRVWPDSVHVPARS